MIAAVVVFAALTVAQPIDAGHGTEPGVATVPSDYVVRLVQLSEPIQMVDLRQASEYREGHVPGAINVPTADVPRRYREIPADFRVVLYCDCALRETAAIYGFLWSQGYRKHAILEDGFRGWVRRGYPVAR